MADISDLRGPSKFDPDGDANTVSLRWKSWLEEFEAFADCKGLFNLANTGADENLVDNSGVRKQRRALLLYCAGQKVRETFKSLDGTGDVDDYTAAITALNKHYVVTPNATFQRHLFRKTVQASNETIAQYVSRLRVLSEGCDYRDVNVEIKDQVVCSCLSDSLRTKLLHKGADLTLAKLLQIAASFEAVDMQSREMKVGLEVNRVKSESSSTTKPAQSTRQIECFRCGRRDHIASDPSCIAKGQQCRNCGRMNHFKVKCRSNKGSHRQNSQSGQTASKPHTGQTNFVAKDDTDDEYQHAFACKTGVRSNMLTVNVGGIDIEVIVDSGSDCNIVGRGLWTDLKRQKIKCESRKTSQTIFPYASKQPLKVLGHFDATVISGTNKVETEFVVVDYESDTLLGRTTAEALGLLKIGYQVNSCTEDYTELCMKYSELFDGVGLLKDHEVQLSIDTNVPPVIQPRRNIPFGLREKVEKKLQELIDFDVIEPVPANKPSEWVSPAVVVPKPNGDIRLCIDMRRANEAIKRERHPIPTVDEILLDMNNSQIFSKLDLKWGFHQLLLSENSRDITTFSTHTGLYRYKRLLFGISSAPEIYQHEIRKIVQGIPGVANMSDDLIIHAHTKAEHDQKLEAVFKRLSKAGLTLNKAKCVFGASEVEFLGHKLSSKGIDPGAGKVEAIVNAQPPKDIAEVRSFLGLVNYLCRFIPNLADISEPLRRLTKKDTAFVFGREQNEAFSKLKEALVNHVTLGFFDVSARTKVIADASPIGLGAVLLQIQEGVPRVIYYANRSLSDVERRYSQTEREGLALVWACERFRSYLIGTKFELLTDHKPLLSIYGKRSKPSARIERWVLRLQPFDFTVVHIKGRQNIADPLSRLLDPNRASGSMSKAEFEEMASVRLVAVNSTPSALTTKQIEVESASDPELLEVKKCLKFGNWTDFQGHSSYRAIQTELCVVGHIVLRGNRLVIPKNLRAQVITLAHEGHLGIVGTKQNLRSKVWWPNIDSEAESFCRSCHSCQITSKGPCPEPIRSTRLPTGPWEDIAADYLGPLPNGDYILVVIDYYSRFYEVRFLKTITAEKTIEALDSIFHTHGLPLSLKTDNGPCFIAQVFKEYLFHHGINHYRITPRWPQANGEVERQNASLLKRIKIAFSEGRDYKTELLKYVRAYRSIPHPSTGKPPAELLYGRVIRTKLPIFSDERVDLGVCDRDSCSKGSSKIYCDEHRNAKQSDMQPGDVVLMRNERPGKVETPFLPTPVTVREKKGSSVKVECSAGRMIERNASYFKQYLPPVTTIVGDSEPGGGADVDGSPETFSNGTRSEEPFSNTPRRPPGAYCNTN